MKPHDLISNESREKLEQIAAKTGVGILLLHITGIESLCFLIQSFQGVQEFNIDAHRMEALLNLIQRLGNIETQEDFLNVADQLNNTGIKARSQGKYYSAFLCYRFALAVAIYFRDWFGVKSLTGNIWMIAESIKDLLRVNVMPPSADDSGLAKLTQLVDIAGNSMRVGESVQPEDEYLMPTASFIREDAEELLPVVNDFADTISQVSNEQKLYVLQSQHRLAAMANKIDIRRATLTELYLLAMDHEKYEIALNTVIEELAQVTIFDLFVDSGNTLRGYPIRGYRREGDKIVQFTEPDHGFSAVWDLYLKSRQHIDESSGKESLYRYTCVFRQMQYLRLHATCAGGTYGHRLSYDRSKFLHPIGCDYIYLLKKAGNIDTALTVAEQLHSRSMVDWMARSHHTNRLVRHKRLIGSINAVMPASLTEIRCASLENNAPLLFYLETHDGYEVWLQCTDGSLVSSHIHPPKNMINRILKNLSSVPDQQALESPKGGQRHHGIPLRSKPLLNKLNSDLSELYLALFPPKVRESLNKAETEKLVIITDSLLEYVPFCALRTEDGKYLIEKFGLTYWPSVTAWLLTKTSAKIRSSIPELLRSLYRQDRFNYKPTELPPLPEIPRAVVFGNPDFTWASSAQNNKQVQQLKLNPLRGTEEEAQQVGKILSVDPFLTTDASSHNLFDRANVVPIIHLATHGVLDTENPEDSFIALADGKLSANFLYESDRPILANLVTLSACQTALGGEHPDSSIGLTNAFLIAGANAVVSTLWSIDDLRTVPLIVEFYRKILDGENIAEALRNAQTEFLHEPQLQHPYYWAAFKLIGNSSNPLLEAT